MVKVREEIEGLSGRGIVRYATGCMELLSWIKYSLGESRKVKKLIMKKPNLPIIMKQPYAYHDLLLTGSTC